VLKSKSEVKKIRKERIRKRVRKQIKGVPSRPRLIVIRSNRYIYVQVVDDLSGRILTSASTLEKEFREKARNTKNKEASQLLGSVLAKRLKEKSFAANVSREDITDACERAAIDLDELILFIIKYQPATV